MEFRHKNEIFKLIKGKVLEDELLSKYTSFKIGGPAELLVIPKDNKDLKNLMMYLYKHSIGYTLIGNGSNLLVSDDGLSGVVIKLPKDNIKVEVVDNKLVASANAMLPFLAEISTRKGLSGLEFAAGLPASLGGAIVMNAGIGDLRAIGDLLIRVTTMLPDGQIKIYNKDELSFGYRKSLWKEKKEILLEAELELVFSDSDKIREEVRDILDKRKKSQPLTWPNAGCIFKNPLNDSAGRLIDKAGGKGLRVGDAQVSTQHANFIINLGKATAKDVLQLITKVENLVLEKFNVKLSREVLFLS